MACFLKEAFFQTGGETVLAFRDAAIKGLFDVQGRDSAGVKNKFPLCSEAPRQSQTLRPATLPLHRHLGWQTDLPWQYKGRRAYLRVEIPPSRPRTR